MRGVFPFIPTVSERLVWILENRESTATGRVLRNRTGAGMRSSGASALSVSAGLARAHVGQIILSEGKREMNMSTARAIAWAAQVSYMWLTTGQGSPDDADVPKSPGGDKLLKRALVGTYGALPGWLVCARLALELSPPLKPEMAVLAGADMPIPRGFRPEKLTPEIVRAACDLAWRSLSEPRRGEYSDTFLSEKAREQDVGGGKRDSPKLLRKSGYPPSR
jgi:hypothetical protein